MYCDTKSYSWWHPHNVGWEHELERAWRDHIACTHISIGDAEGVLRQAIVVIVVLETNNLKSLSSIEMDSDNRLFYYFIVIWAFIQGFQQTCLVVAIDEIFWKINIVIWCTLQRVWTKISKFFCKHSALGRPRMLQPMCVLF